MNAMRVGRNYANKFFFRRFRSSSGAQYHCQCDCRQRSSDRFPNPSVTSVTRGEAVSVVFYCGVILQSTGWINRYGRSTYEEWKAKYKMHKMLKELDRKKMESSEAYLETIHREMEALKPRLLKREKMDDWELNNYEREIAVLKSKLCEWTQGMDAPAPAPQE